MFPEWAPRPRREGGTRSERSGTRVHWILRTQVAAVAFWKQAGEAASEATGKLKFRAVGKANLGMLGGATPPKGGAGADGGALMT